MSETKIGKVAPFPPLPGQPFPPARNHPRWKELYRLHDEWMMKYWPFSSEKKRARIPFMNLAGFSTWCAPAADFDRMVWGGRIAGIFFLADDYIDSGKMLDRIPGFKQAATGNGPLHEEDQAEICHDIVFRAIKATSHPKTFEQLTKCTHEWWDSNIHEKFQSLDQYLAVRRVNIAMYFANAYFRYTLDINLTDEQVNHPLMREAEGIVSDHVGLTNDFFSYLKEKLTNSDDTNIIRMLMDHENLTYEQAKVVIEKKIRQKEQDFIPAGMAVLNDPELGKDPEVRRWIQCLPYCMGGNNAWSQESGRYNVGVIDGIEFPSLSYEAEATPEDEVVDDSVESARRDVIFNVKDVPPPDFTIDDDEIFKTNPHSHPQDKIPANPPRPVDVGIIGMELHIPDRLAPSAQRGEIVLSVVTSLLQKYAVDPAQVGRVDASSADLQALNNLLPQDVEYGSGTLLDAVNWVEGKGWDGRFAVVFVDGVALLVGPNAPLVVEATRGSFVARDAPEDVESAYLTALDGSFSSYRSKVAEAAKAAGAQKTSVTVSNFDFSVFQLPHADLAEKAFKALVFHDYLSSSDSPALRAALLSRFHEQVSPSLLLLKTGLFGSLASVVTEVPPYELFDKRVSLFAYGESSTFFSIKVRGDTSHIRRKLDLRKRLENSGEETSNLQAESSWHRWIPYIPAFSRA